MNARELIKRWQKERTLPEYDGGMKLIQDALKAIEKDPKLTTQEMRDLAAVAREIAAS